MGGREFGPSRERLFQGLACVEEPALHREKYREVVPGLRHLRVFATESLEYLDRLIDAAFAGVKNSVEKPRARAVDPEVQHGVEQLACFAETSLRGECNRTLDRLLGLGGSPGGNGQRDHRPEQDETPSSRANPQTRPRARSARAADQRGHGAVSGAVRLR